MPRLKALDEHWEQEPPVGLLVGAFMGHKPPAKKTKAAKKADVSKLRQMFPKGRIGIG